MTMACGKVLELLERFHDQELAAPEHQAVREHLDGCIRCSGELKKIAGVGDLLKSHFEAVSASEDFSDMWKRISSGLESGASEAAPARGRWFSGILRFPKTVWATAGAIAVALVVLLAYLPGSHTPAVASNDCIIDSVGSETGSVMVYETGNTKMKIIWVMGQQNEQEGTEKGVTS